MSTEMIGPILALALSCIGSGIGCGIAGMVSHGAMSQSEEGHGKLIGMSAAPSSQIIYGFILMLMLKNSLAAGTLTELSAIWIGLLSGLSIMSSAIIQGKCCASGIQASIKKPDVYGKCWAAIGIAESVALFAFVFATLLI